MQHLKNRFKNRFFFLLKCGGVLLSFLAFSLDLPSSQKPTQKLEVKKTFPRYPVYFPYQKVAKEVYEELLEEQKKPQASEEQSSPSS